MLAVSLFISIISRTIDQKYFIFNLFLLFLLLLLLLRFGYTSAADSGGNEICPTGFSKLPIEQQQQMIDDNNSLLHCYCDQLSFEQQQHVKMFNLKKIILHYYF